MALNDTDDLRDELQNVGENFDINFLNKRLDEANRKLAGGVGRTFQDNILVEDNDQEDFNLAWDELESFDRVRDDDSEVDSSNYTEDLSAGTVSFTTSYAEDNIAENEVIEFYYTPKIFKDLELMYAVQRTLRISNIVTGDGEEPARVERLKEDINELENLINTKSGTSRVLDHQPRFHPDRGHRV